MPERLPTIKPTVTVGSVLTSGDPNTGQICQTLGGSKTVERKSGVVGPDINLHVGGGRLDTVHVHWPAAASGFTTNAAFASGLPVTFYDSAVAVSGGPLNASGHKIVLKVFPHDLYLMGTGATVNSGLLGQGRAPFPVGAVFTSGLCVTTASGQHGWTATFTPVVSGSTGTTP